MLVNNYFKSNGQLFFFVDTVPESCEDAYVDAIMNGGTVSVFRPAKVAGPWDSAAVIGFRTRAEVLSDMAAEVDEDKLEDLSDELEVVNELFYSIGRTLPQVAA